MDSFVKQVFLMILGSTVALFLFWLFFGVKQTDTWWKGALWTAAEGVEVGISRYYYDYCYLPVIHNGDGVDLSIGGRFRGSSYNNTVFSGAGSATNYNCTKIYRQTGTNLSYNDTAADHVGDNGSKTDYIKFNAGSDSLEAFWSTGWR